MFVLIRNHQYVIFVQFVMQKTEILRLYRDFFPWKQEKKTANSGRFQSKVRNYMTTKTKVENKGSELSRTKLNVVFVFLLGSKALL